MAGSGHVLPASLVAVKKELKVGTWTPRDQALAPYRSPDDGVQVFCLSMIFSENRCPLFQIMLHDSNPAAPAPSDGRSGRLGRNPAKGYDRIESKQQRHAGPDQCCRHVIAPAKIRAQVVP
jgi:hypothetical protein